MLDRSHAPAIKPFGVLTMPPQQVERVGQYTYLHVLQHGNLDISSLNIVTSFDGARADNRHRMAHKLYHRLSRGTASMDPAQVAEFLDVEGAMLSMRGQVDYASMSCLLLNNRIHAVSDLIYDIFENPIFSDAEFDGLKLREAQTCELNLKKPSFLASHGLSQLLYGPDHPKSIIPTRDDVMAVTREMLDAVHRQETRHHDVHIFLAGNVAGEPIELVRELARRIDSNISDPLPIEKPLGMKPSGQKEIRVVMSESLQTGIAMGMSIEIDRMHPDYIDLRYAVLALGGYFSSRLMTNIREEKGLCYGIGAILMCDNTGTRMVISAQCNAAGVEQAVNEIRREVEQMQSRPLTHDEMDSLRGYAFSQLATMLDTPMSIQDYHLSQLTVQLPPDYYEHQCRCLAALTPERIQEMACKYLAPDKLLTALAGTGV